MTDDERATWKARYLAALIAEGCPVLDAEHLCEELTDADMEDDPVALAMFQEDLYREASGELDE